MKVRKKPVEVEAYQLDEKNVRSVAEWCNAIVKYDDLTGEPSISIFTLEGTMVGQVGDWIIKGVNGEFYPCKHDIFLKTYDMVDSEQKQSSVTGKIEVLSVEDNSDGSMIVKFDMSQDMVHAFTKIGLIKVLRDSAEKAIEEHGVE